VGSLAEVKSTHLDALESYRKAQGGVSVREMDARDRYSSRFHVAGDNASMLTAGITVADLEQLCMDKVQPVAVCGNSMGWYTALGVGGALSLPDCGNLIETMGQYQNDNIIGGQLIYPMVDEDWLPMATRMHTVNRVLTQIDDLFLSIRLGGQAILAGSEAALSQAIEQLPEVTVGRHTFPLRLPLHSAFHTPLMAATSQRALTDLNDLTWHRPSIPLIDGTGQIWSPFYSAPRQLRHYTLTNQVHASFDFTKMIASALGEYAPELIILPGPGGSLGSAVGQVLIQLGWQGIRNRAQFTKRQQTNPVLISMSREEQRALVVQ